MPYRRTEMSFTPVGSAYRLACLHLLKCPAEEMNWQKLKFFAKRRNSFFIGTSFKKSQT